MISPPWPIQAGFLAPPEILGESMNLPLQFMPVLNLANFFFPLSLSLSLSLSLYIYT